MSNNANVCVSVESEVIQFRVDAEGKEVPLDGREDRH